MKERRAPCGEGRSLERETHLDLTSKAKVYNLEHVTVLALKEDVLRLRVEKIRIERDRATYQYEYELKERERERER